MQEWSAFEDSTPHSRSYGTEQWMKECDSKWVWYKRLELIINSCVTYATTREGSRENN